MNQAAKLVSDSLVGDSFKTVNLAGKTYKIYPPTIKIISRGISQWAKATFDDKDQNTFSVIAQIPATSPHILRGISCFIVGDVPLARFRVARLSHQLAKATPNEISRAMAVVIEQIGAQDFFDCAVLLKSVVNMAANPR